MAMKTDNPGSHPTGLLLAVRALRSRNYRLYFAGQGISLVGTWMQQIAMSWLVYRLTDSAFLLGLVGFLGNIPVLILAPLAGVLADRWNRHRMLVVIQSLAMVQALALAILVLANLITVGQIFFLSIFLGMITAFDLPIRQSFIIELLEKPEDLGNAIALNSSMVNGARLIGPSLAGILIALTGEGICFLLNGISYIAVIAALMAMKITPRIADGVDGSMLRKMKEGFDYAAHDLPIRSVLLLLSLISLVAMPYITLMPIFAKDILGGGPHTLGFLMSATGMGALTGAVYLASRRNARGLIAVIGLAAGVFGVGLILFSFSRTFWLSMIFMYASGCGMMVHMASCNTVLQSISYPDKRGRIMGFFTMAFRGMIPFGSLIAGSLASGIGAPHTLALGGVVAILGALIYARRLPALQEQANAALERNAALNNSLYRAGNK